MKKWFVLFAALIVTIVFIGCLTSQSEKANISVEKVLNKKSTDSIKSQTKVDDQKIVNKKSQGLKITNEQLIECQKIIKKSKYQKLNSAKICNSMDLFPKCKSINNQSIFHFEKSAKDSSKGKRILVISLIHGDEVPSGQISYSWIQRLVDLKSRNTWRVIPMANPDGFFKRTRYNANKVDVNRNFPTKDWEEKALQRWKTVKKSDPRKFPGKSANSQPETQCLVDHISDFNPDFIISIHTPLGVLDFDGPKNLNLPKFTPLPWISLGNYPGSLGRYMWKERNIPVLTIELNNELAVYDLEKFDKLQDISGTVAIQAIKKTNKKKVVK